MARKKWRKKWQKKNFFFSSSSWNSYEETYENKKTSILDEKLIFFAEIDSSKLEFSDSVVILN